MHVVKAHPKARKRHTCGTCRAAILPGDKYLRWTTIYDGTVNTAKLCLSCEDSSDQAWNEGYFDQAEGTISHEDVIEWAREYAAVNSTAAALCIRIDEAQLRERETEDD